MKTLKISLCLVVQLSCFSNKAQQLFSQISATQSGITFNNILLENKEFNTFTYGYLYNGGGIAVGDINNDGLQDLYFTGNMVPNKLYLNLGNLKFRDITDSAKVQSDLGFKTGVTFVDINQDGFLDIYVCRSALSDKELRRNLLYINNGNLTFTERAKEYGIDDASFSTQSYFYDMDLDGDLDMFLLNHPPDMNYANKVQLTYDEKGKLAALTDTHRLHVSYRYYENINKRFKDKTISAGLGTHHFGLSAIIADFNADGFPDIYACNDYSSPDLLFINNKNGTFTNKLDDYFKHTSYSSMGSDYADINNDGHFDLMVTDMVPESIQRQKQLKGIGNYDNHNKRVEYNLGYQYAKNVLQLNNGNFTYSDISYLAGVAFTEWSWAPLLADFDNDGLKDMYVTNGYLRDVTDNDFMMFEGDSIRKEVINSNSGEDAMKVLSAIPSNKMINYLYKNNGNLTFNNITTNAGMDTPSWSNGAVYADLDNDGDLDIIVNNVYDTPFLYKNNTTDNKTANFIRFKLKGSATNIDGIGAIVEIETPDGKKQIQHFMPDKGYLSSNEWLVHFGIGRNDKANVTVTWPEKKQQSLKELAANTVYTLELSNAKAANSTPEKSNSFFTDLSTESKINYTYKENQHIDFKLEPLLPHQFSKMGPCIAVADINADGRDDFFVGGSKNNEAFLYTQDAKGSFDLLKSATISADKQFEDSGAEFFDADNDGDKDLLVVSGGNEYPEKETMYPVRLYTNDGKGNFTKSVNFPAIYTSSKAIAINDYDKDGWLDVFIGGRVVPGHYGLIPNSYLLRNTNGTFSDITSQLPSVFKIGMVSDATWCDVDADGWNDLVLVGEWMPLTVFKNNQGTLNNTASILQNSYGWWNTVFPCDIDSDGDIDLVGGNIGVNSRYRGNEEFPITMTVSDFDNNGSTDCIISVYQDGVSHPLALRDNVVDQMTILKKKFLRYRDYSKAQLTDIFSAEQLKNAQTFKANNIGNTIFLNDGKGNFTSQLLVVKAQVFPIQTVLAEDLDKDGKPDLLLAGNDYSSEVESGRNDAGIGLMLSNQGSGRFRSLSVLQSGFYVPGDVKCMKKIKVNNKPCILVGKNEGKLQLLSYTN